MNEKLNFLLRTALSAATEDRESFICKFSTLLEEYAGLDKKTSEKAGKHMASGLSVLKAELENEAIRKQAAKEADQTEIAAKLEEIIERLDELARTLNNQKA